MNTAAPEGEAASPPPLDPPGLLAGDEVRPDPLVRRMQLGLAALGAALVAFLLYQVTTRVLFPWDLFVWSEGMFMTNMLKIAAGMHTHGPVANANSFIYSTGLEYVCFLLLRPFGLHLDIRGVRAVVVLISLGGALLAAINGARLLRALSLTARSCRLYVVFGFFLTALILFKSVTIDVPHPDSLVLLHLMLTFFVTMRAIGSTDVRSAAIALAVSALGITVKQTAGFVMVGVVGALALLRPDLRRVKPALIVLGAGLGAALPALYMAVGSPHARYWKFEVLSKHNIYPHKLPDFFRNEIFGVPHQFILYALVPFCLLSLLTSPRLAARRYALVWLAIALTGALPAFSSFWKALAVENTFQVLNGCAALIVLPVLWDYATRARTPATGFNLGAAVPLGLYLLLLVAAFPVRWPPTVAQWNFGRELDAEVAKAVREGKRVLVTHGAMPLIHAGVTTVPLDSCNAILELRFAGESHRAQTVQRLASKTYGKIFVIAGEWYDGDVLGALEANYREVGIVRASSGQPGAKAYREQRGWAFGYQELLMNRNVRILEPR